MRNRMLVVTLIIAAASAAVVIGVKSFAAPTVEADTKALMRKKLLHAQSILEGLSLEDYKKIGDGAKELSQISLEAQYLATHSPRYNQLAAEFRVHVDKVAAMAEKKNLEGATLAYVNVVTSCVECHQIVRGGEKLASK